MLTLTLIVLLTLSDLTLTVWADKRLAKMCREIVAEKVGHG